LKREKSQGTSMKLAVWIALLALLPAVAVAAERPEWAYGPEQTGQSVPRRPDDGKLKQAPGSARFYTQAQIDDPMNPPDWFPDEHPPMPRVVAHGNGTTVRACIGCHLANGHGHPENSRLPGATSAYLARQLADFRSGARAGVTSKVMIGIAKAMTEDEMRAASDYFAGLKTVRWTRVVEADTVPKTYWRGNRRLPLAEGGSEPIGDRIIEVPEDPARNLLRDPHSGNISYVPVGSLAKGEALVATGGAGKTIPCAHLPWSGAARHRRRAGDRRTVAAHGRAPALRHAIRRPHRSDGGADESGGRQAERRRHPGDLRLRGLARAVSSTRFTRRPAPRLATSATVRSARS
jgi:cytochrome c553